MAKEALVAYFLRPVTLNAERFRKRVEVALETSRIPPRERFGFAGKIFRVFRFRVERVAGLTSCIAEETEVRGVAESGERLVLRLKLRGPPIDHGRTAAFVDGVTFHANSRRLRIGELTENVGRSWRRRFSLELRGPCQPGKEKWIGMTRGSIIKGQAIWRPVPATGGDPFFRRFRRDRCRGGWSRTCRDSGLFAN